MKDDTLRLLEHAVDYVRAYAIMNDEPDDGDCWKTVHEAEALLRKPTADELAAKLAEAHEHMADSLPYFPSDDEREGETVLSAEIDDMLARHRRYS